MKDLIGKQVKLTFRSKSASQFKAFNVLDYKDGFFKVQGVEGDAGKLSEGTWLQNIQEIDCIADIKPTVEQAPVELTAKKDIPTVPAKKRLFSRSGPSQNKLL